VSGFDSQEGWSWNLQIDTPFLSRSFIDTSSFYSHKSDQNTILEIHVFLVQPHEELEHAANQMSQHFAPHNFPRLTQAAELFPKNDLEISRLPQKE
jgi:hypothetical protein